MFHLNAVFNISYNINAFSSLTLLVGHQQWVIIIIIIKNEKIRVTLCENAAGALYIVNKMCVDGPRNVEG